MLGETAVPTDAIQWPVKQRDIHNSIFDSRVWDDFAVRDDDIVIATWGKAGTTWTQQIVGQLVFDGREDLAVGDMSPWLDFVVPPVEVIEAAKAQSHRRFVKTHLPLDALTYSPKAKYIYVGRDGRDVVWSMHNHHANFIPGFYAHFKTNPRRGPDPGPELEPPTPDVAQYFREWFAGDGYPWWPFWENIRTWWAARSLPNILFVHFASLKADLSGEMRRIASFLDIPVDEARWPAIVEHCTFDYMKAHADLAAPGAGAFWEGGATTFIHKGTNGRWRDLLTAEEIAAYEQRARVELGEECAHWLATGEGLAPGRRDRAA
ncbi:MAG: sulfotransferase [Caulobacteraceae bacterium]|nr:sulfotransferase [Caulobacteraceae bacterium]